MFTKIKSSVEYDKFNLVSDDNNTYYEQILNDIEYSVYLDVIRYSSKIKKAIYIENLENKKLYFVYENKTEYSLKSKCISEILLDLFKTTSYEVSIKKDNIKNLNNIYKLLDNKFRYFEIRIREIELNPIKKDIDWIILSKYYILLDSKIFLYDLQQDIFKYIDKNEVVKYGLIPKYINQNLYSKESLLLDYNLYYGPISMLYVRMSLMLDDYDPFEEVKKLDILNQKYFCFMYLYILILNVNMDISMNIYGISNYVIILKKIKEFIKKYESLIRK